MASEAIWKQGPDWDGLVRTANTSDTLPPTTLRRWRRGAAPPLGIRASRQDQRISMGCVTTYSSAPSAWLRRPVYSAFAHVGRLAAE